MAGLVLAGGRSTRLGSDKPTLRLGGRSLLERAVLKLRGLTEPVFVSVGSVEPPDLAGALPLYDRWPAGGPMAGIAAGLVAARPRSLLVLACDLPFAPLPVLTKLIEISPRADVVVPRWSRGVEPLCAVYSPECLDHLTGRLQGDRSLSAFITDSTGLRIRYVEEVALLGIGEPAQLFFNVNTPRDLAEAERLLSRVEGRQ